MATKYDRDEDYLHTLKLAKARGESVDDLIAIERKEKALRSGKKQMASKKRTRRPSKRAHKIHTGGMPSSHVAHAKHGKKRRAKKARKTHAKKAHAKHSTSKRSAAKGSTKPRYFTSKSGRTWCLAVC